MRIGTELRQARERAGLSAEQIAERTKIQRHRIEALENDNFENLPAGIYLDGIVRAYAHEVGVNHEPLIESVRSARAEAAKNWETGPADLDAFASERPVSSEPPARTISVASNVAPPPKAQVVGTPAASAPDDDIDFDVIHRRAEVDELPHVLDVEHDPVVATSQHEPTGSRDGAGRFVLPLLLLLAAAGLGAYFYLAHGGYDFDRPRDTVASSALPDASLTPARASTVGRGGPNAASDRRSSATPDRAQVNTRTAVRETEVVTGTSGPQDRATSDAAPKPALPNRRGAPPSTAATTTPPAAAPATRERTGTPASTIGTASVKDVSGSWTLATHVESSSYQRFEGLQLGYDLQLQQAGNRVRGTGRKISENGDGISSRVQTPISVDGTINGDRLTLTFNERGARRPTEGKFVLLVDDSRTMRGRFSSSAARSSGTVEAHRVPR